MSVLRLGYLSLVCSFADAARKRSWNECLFKDRVDDSKNRVVQDSVAYCRLMYPTAFGVVNPKTIVGSVFICFVAQVATQLKNILLDFLLKLGNVRLIPLVALEHLPCRKESLCGNY